MPRRKRSLLQMVHSAVPFGLGETKPHHFTEMLRILWENRDDLGHAWRVLTRGVCDGCALGTSGLSDWTIRGTHLCLVRLNLLRLNTMGPAPEAEVLSDADQLAARGSRALRELGRIPFPMRRRRGESRFSRVTWDEVFEDVGARWGAVEPDRTAMYVTSRGITNEVYYVAQKVMRFLGTNNVDNSARLCHSPSTSGLKSTVGVAATTCSYRDWYDADLIVFFGSNPANDQPVSVKYLHEAKRRGARVVMVNTYREPGMERYWIPSTPDSALFGTRITDAWFQVKVGGDLAFLNAVQRLLIERGQVATEFIAGATEGYEALREELYSEPFERLLEIAGTDRAAVEAFADEVGGAERAVLVWSMGITQHVHGADTVRAICNLGLLREAVGRRGTGLMPIRGHSGVQGGAEMGAYATAFPGGLEINPENARRFSELWGFEVPEQPGLTTVDALEAAREGRLDAYWMIGGNFLETMPQPQRMAEALGRIGLRVHTDLFLTTQMLVEPADTVYVLPSRTRYEQEGGGTETSTERRVIFSPEIPREGLGEARSEWRLLLDLARAVRPDDRARPDFADGAAVRADIERANPAYTGIARLAKKGDQFQWGGPHLCAERRFPTPSGKAHFRPVRPPQLDLDPAVAREWPFLIATRRGKQFNSMIQKHVDQLTGAARDHVFINVEDARALGLGNDDPVRLESVHGEYRGRVFIADVARGTLQGHWPEVNVLLPPDRVDTFGGVPDYNARVRVHPETVAAR